MSQDNSRYTNLEMLRYGNKIMSIVMDVFIVSDLAVDTVHAVRQSH